MKTFTSIVFLFYIQIQVFGQKPGKGSDSTNPWSESFETFTCYHQGDTTALYKSIAASAPPFKQKHTFGKWQINYSYPHYYTLTSLEQNKENLKLVPMLLGYPGAVKTLANYKVDINFSGTDPSKKIFFGNIIYNDSLFESYDAIFFAKRENYFKHNLRKTASGKLITSDNDTASIFILLDFDNRDSMLNSSYVRFRNAIIYLKPKFSTAADKMRYSNGYSGFDLIYNEIVVGGIYVGKDFFGGPEYKYWLRSDQDDQINQSAAAALFIIVKLF